MILPISGLRSGERAGQKSPTNSGTRDIGAGSRKVYIWPVLWYYKILYHLLRDFPCKSIKILATEII